eukprot:gene7171-10943_t
MAEAKKLFASGRPNSAKVLVLITDGVPCMADTPNQDVKCTKKTGTACSCLHKLPSFDPFDPPANNTDPQPDLHQAHEATKASAAMQKGGITVVGVAVGSDFGKRGQAFMDGIVSKPASKYLFNPKSWKQLPALVKEIVDSIWGISLRRDGRDDGRDGRDDGRDGRDDGRDGRDDGRDGRDDVTYKTEAIMHHFGAEDG